MIRGAAVKIRRPWGVFLLAIVTLGIYYFVWYYIVHRELREFGRSSPEPTPLREVDPVISLLAITLGGFLVIPPFVSTYRASRESGGRRSSPGPRSV